MARRDVIEMDVENPIVSGEGVPEDLQSEKPVFLCDLCRQEIFEGDTYIHYSGDIFCSTHHLGEHLIKQGLAEERVASNRLVH